MPDIYFIPNYSYATLAEIKVDTKWDDLFAGLGKTKAQDNFPYPSIEEIKAEWQKQFPVIREGLASLSEDKLDKEIPSPLAR